MLLKPCAFTLSSNASVTRGLPHDVSSEPVESSVLPRFQPGCIAAVASIAVSCFPPCTHVTPLSENDRGAVLADSQVPMKPNFTVACDAIFALWPVSVAVTWSSVSVIFAFQALPACWPDGHSQVSFQPSTAAPRLVTATSALKPPSHWPVTEYVTRHPASAASAGVAMVRLAARVVTPARAAPSRRRIVPVEVNMRRPNLRRRSRTSRSGRCRSRRTRR